MSKMSSKEKQVANKTDSTNKMMICESCMYNHYGISYLSCITYHLKRFVELSIKGIPFIGKHVHINESKCWRYLEC